jgi:hypothetical protein
VHHWFAVRHKAGGLSLRSEAALPAGSAPWFIGAAQIRRSANQCHIPSSPGMQLHPIALPVMPASLILPPFA